MRCARLHSVRQELPGGGLLLRLHLGVDALAVPVAAISASSAAVAAAVATALASSVAAAGRLRAALPAVAAGCVARRCSKLPRALRARVLHGQRWRDVFLRPRLRHGSARLQRWRQASVPLLWVWCLLVGRLPSSVAAAALTAALIAALATSALAAALASTAARHAAAFTSATATVHAQSR